MICSQTVLGSATKPEGIELPLPIKSEVPGAFCDRLEPKPWLSIIIPTLNEASCIGRTLSRAKAARHAQCIVVDGHSKDTTSTIARSLGATILTCSPGRAQQMNYGQAHASGEVFLFLHADTLLPHRFDRAIRRILSREGVIAGAFGLSIGGRGVSLRVIESLANLRSRFMQMPYGDQAIFVRSEVFKKVGGFADLPVMEDYEWIRRARRLGKVVISEANVITSARRWRLHGVWQTTLRHQLILAAYHLGLSPRRIARWRDGVIRPTVRRVMKLPTLPTPTTASP